MTKADTTSLKPHFLKRIYDTYPRTGYLLTFFMTVWVYFILQKPVFMSCNAGKAYRLTDYLDVMYHGAGLDATTAGYMTALPFLLALLSVWVHRLPIRRIMLPYYIIIMAVVTMIFYGDLSLFSFWQSKIDASIFIYLDSPKNAMASVSTGYILVRTLLVVLTATAMCFLLWSVTPSKMPRVESVKRRSLNTVGMTVLGGLLFLVIRGGFRVSTANVGDAYFSTDQYLNLSAINPTFNLLSSISRQKRYEDEFNFYDEKALHRNMQGLFPVEEADSTPSVLRTRRPNILVIFMESFGATMIDSLGGVAGVSPHLDKLAHEGIFFTQAYASSFRTDRGTVCTFSGHPGLPTVSIMKIPSLSPTLPNIAATLDKAGYHTEFVYGGDINFTNTKGYLRAGGFETLVSQDDFPMSARNYSKWGVRDDITFDYLYDRLAKRHSQSPWFTAMLTLSSHEPFDVPFSKFGDKTCNAFAYTDDCIGRFVARLRKLPLWDNTLVILLPDHGIPYPKDGERFGPKYFHIPIIWTGGAVTRPMKYEKIMSQTDLAATLLAQLGLPHDDFLYSRDVLSTSYTSPFAFYSFPGGFGFVDDNGASVYDTASDRVFFRTSPDGTRADKGKAILQTLYDDLGRRNRMRMASR